MAIDHIFLLPTEWRIRGTSLLLKMKPEKILSKFLWQSGALKMKIYNFTYQPKCTYPASSEAVMDIWCSSVSCRDELPCIKASGADCSVVADTPATLKKKIRKDIFIRMWYKATFCKLYSKSLPLNGVVTCQRVWKMSLSAFWFNGKDSLLFLLAVGFQSCWCIRIVLFMNKWKNRFCLDSRYVVSIWFIYSTQQFFLFVSQLQFSFPNCMFCLKKKKRSHIYSGFGSFSSYWNIYFAFRIFHSFVAVFIRDFALSRVK